MFFFDWSVSKLLLTDFHENYVHAVFQKLDH